MFALLCVRIEVRYGHEWTLLVSAGTKKWFSFIAKQTHHYHKNSLKFDAIILLQFHLIKRGMDSFLLISNSKIYNFFRISFTKQSKYKIPYFFYYLVFLIYYCAIFVRLYSLIRFIYFIWNYAVLETFSI